MFFLKSVVFLKGKKASGKAAPHRISEWGRTKAPIFNKIHCTINKNKEINPPPTIKNPLFLTLSFWSCWRVVRQASVSQRKHFPHNNHNKVHMNVGRSMRTQTNKKGNN